MMELTFIIGGALRRVFIEGRKVSFITAELGNTPFTIDLDKIEEKETKEMIEKMKLDNKTLKEIALLKTEEAIAKDIKKDFQKSGWRCIKRR